MKAERRHELQTNALAKVVKRAPETWQQYGGRILLAAVAVILVIFLVRYQITTSRANRRQAADSLAMARQMIDQIRDTLPFPGQATPQQVASIRRQSASQAEGAIETAVASSDDRSVTAEALIARGDLNWTLATLPELPGAATQPTLKYERDEKTLLDLASESYKSVLEQFSDQPASVTAARFGLGAIAENRGNWDAARQHYETIEKNQNIAAAYRTQARVRLSSIDRWKTPPLIAPPSTAPTTPSTVATTRSTVPPLPLGPTLSTQPSTTAVEATSAPSQPLPATSPAPSTTPTPAPSR
jgi:hypothetical protein